MKSFEYIRNLLQERKIGLEQVEAAPQNYDSKTLEYARSLYQETLAWYNEELAKQEKNGTEV